MFFLFVRWNRQHRSVSSPHVCVSCWSARHVVPNRQANTGLSLQALQMYRCKTFIFYEELMYPTAVFNYNTFAYIIFLLQVFVFF